MRNCRKCNISLNNNNMYPSHIKNGNWICIKCATSFSLSVHGKRLKSKAAKRCYQKQKEKRKEKQRIYGKTKRGRMVGLKHTNKRQRNLGFNIIIPNPYIDTEIKFDWHHVNDNDVVAVPRNAHRSMYGNNHRERINEWIEIHYDFKL